VSRGRYEEALREADQALQLKPDFRDARLNRARALDALGRAGEARKEFLREGASVTEPGFLGKRRK
jgi:tetratricopeptide (TPR) repeat protein